MSRFIEARLSKIRKRFLLRECLNITEGIKIKSGGTKMYEALQDQGNSKSFIPKQQDIKSTFLDFRHMLSFFL